MALLLTAVLVMMFFSPYTYAKKKEEYTSSYSQVVDYSGIHDVFPDTYWAGLDALAKAHPNWKFQAFNTGLEWSECFDGTFYTGASELYYGRNLLEGPPPSSDPDYKYLRTVPEDGKNKLVAYYDLYYPETQLHVFAHPTSWYAKDLRFSDESTGNYVTKEAFSWAGNYWEVKSAPNWIQASEEAIRYCMDPRNWFTEEQIFQFEDMLMNEHSYHPTVAEVSSVFENVSGGNRWTQAEIVSEYPNSLGRAMTYGEAIYAIGNDINVNPVFLASRIVQEQGAGNGPLISGEQEFIVQKGTDKDKKITGGFYNYFNIEAYDGKEASYTAIINNGLTEAYYADPQWNTRFRALLGGSRKTKNLYLDRGQISFYFQKFCVDSIYDTRYGMPYNRCFWGQYMGSLTTPQLEARKAYRSYRGDGTDMSKVNAQHLFVIPVYDKMPTNPEKAPTADGNPNYKIGSVFVNGKALEGFKPDTTDYSMTVNYDVTTVRFNIHPYAETSVISVGTLNNGSSPVTGDLVGDQNLLLGDNVFKIVCTAENKDQRTYTLKIHRDGNIIYGDINADKKFNSLDLAYMTSHLLKKNVLTGEALEAADISGDSKVNSLDLAYLTSYLLGKITKLPR